MMVLICRFVAHRNVFNCCNQGGKQLCRSEWRSRWLFLCILCVPLGCTIEKTKNAVRDLGQPVLEFNWNFHVTTGNFEADKKIRESIKHDKYERLGGQKIASMWGRSIMNAVKRKGLENIDFTFDAEELKSPAEKRAEMRGQLKK